jgi:hypothetical protein
MSDALKRSTMDKAVSKTKGIHNTKDEVCSRRLYQVLEKQFSAVSALSRLPDYLMGSRFISKGKCGCGRRKGLAYWVVGMDGTYLFSEYVFWEGRYESTIAFMKKSNTRLEVE